MENFADRLARAIQEKQSSVVVGLDPRLNLLPGRSADSAPFGSTREAADAVLSFNRTIIEAISSHAVAVKPQIAFYENLGPDGLTAFAETCRAASDAGLLVIGDIKRGDIGSTATAYAQAYMGADAPFPCDAVTVNGYLGTDSTQPWIDAAAATGSGFFVLVKTSNPSSSELQNLEADGKSIFNHMANLVNRWGESLVGTSGYSSVGAVVGATWPGESEQLRMVMPKNFFLVPGYGAQGGTAEDVRPAFNEDGLGAVVNASRSIIFAYAKRDDLGPDDWAVAVEDAARAMKEDLETVRPGSTIQTAES